MHDLTSYDKREYYQLEAKGAVLSVAHKETQKRDL